MGIALTEEDRVTYDTSNLRNWKEEEEEVDSGASTPPMWSPPRSRNYQGPNHPGFRTMSPTSRAQAIARGQRELMDMVSRMPEACYELSLKDIVEHQHPVTVVEAEQQTTISNSKVVPRRDHRHHQKKKAVVARSRSGSYDNGGGLFLKMVFPVSFGPTRKGRLRSNSKGRGSGAVVDGRVSPRPLLLGEGEGSNDHWWTKEVAEDEEEDAGKESLGFSSSGKSGSSKSTGSSSSRCSSKNSTRQASFSCWSCIYSNKDKKRAT